MKLETMSKNIVNVVTTLSKNEMLGRLLTHDVPTPYLIDLAKPNPSDLINLTSSKAKIFPYPFDPEATEYDGSFIRVYYSTGEFNDNETIAESTLTIDVIVSKTLWLINDKAKPTDRGQSLIRPYDIAGRVIDLVGKRSIGSSVKLKFQGYSHLYVNAKFDCIRLYADYMSIEA